MLAQVWLLIIEQKDISSCVWQFRTYLEMMIHLSFPPNKKNRRGEEVGEESMSNLRLMTKPNLDPRPGKEEISKTNWMLIIGC